MSPLRHVLNSILIRPFWSAYAKVASQNSAWRLTLPSEQRALFPQWLYMSQHLLYVSYVSQHLHWISHLLINKHIIIWVLFKQYSSCCILRQLKSGFKFGGACKNGTVSHSEGECQGGTERNEEQERKSGREKHLILCLSWFGHRPGKEEWAV